LLIKAGENFYHHGKHVSQKNIGPENLRKPGGENILFVNFGESKNDAQRNCRQKKRINKNNIAVVVGVVVVRKEHHEKKQKARDAKEKSQKTLKKPDENFKIPMTSTEFEYKQNDARKKKTDDKVPGPLDRGFVQHSRTVMGFINYLYRFYKRPLVSLRIGILKVFDPQGDVRRKEHFFPHRDGPVNILSHPEIENPVKKRIEPCMAHNMLSQGIAARRLAEFRLKLPAQSQVKDVPDPGSAVILEMMIRVVAVFREHVVFRVAQNRFLARLGKIQGIQGYVPVGVDKLIEIQFRGGNGAGIDKPPVSEINKEIFILKGEHAPVKKTGPAGDLIFNHKAYVTPP